MRCSRCSAVILPPATACDCAARDAAKASQPTPPAPPTPSTAAAARMIPTKNKPALIGYYLGIASLIPYVAFLSVLAVLLGGIGLSTAKATGQGKGHAVTAIVAGLVSIVVWGGQWLGWWRLPIATPFGK